MVSLQPHFSTAHGRVILDADNDALVATISFTPTVPLGVVCHHLRFEYEYEKDVQNGGCSVVFKADENATKEAVIELKVNPQNGMESFDVLLRFGNYIEVGKNNRRSIWFGYRLDDIAVTRNSIHVL